MGAATWVEPTTAAATTSIRISRLLLPRRILLRLCLAVLLRCRVLRMGLQSVGCAGRLLMGLGRSAVVRILRLLFQSVPGICHRGTMDDGLRNQPELASCLSAQAEANANANAKAAAGQDDSGNQDASAQGGGNGGGVVLTPEVKQAIADEVKAQLAAEQQSASAPAPAAAPAGSEHLHRFGREPARGNSRGARSCSPHVHRERRSERNGSRRARLFIVVGRRSDARRRHTGFEQQRPGAGERQPEV